MRVRNFKGAFPWGIWSEKTSDIAAPAGWPSTVTNPSTIIGYPCAVFGPMTPDQAMEFYWRVKTGHAVPDVTVFGGVISSELTGDMKRYNQATPPTVLLGDGDERLLVCDPNIVLDRTVGPPYPLIPANITGVYFGTASGASGGGTVTWDLFIMPQYLWLSDTTAFVSISVRLNWQYISGIEFTFSATEQVTAFPVGTLHINGFSTMNLYSDGTGDGTEATLAFDVSLFYDTYFSFSKSTAADPIRVAATGAYVTGATYPLTNLSDIDIIA